ERHAHLAELGAALAIVRAVYLAREERLPHVFAVARQLLIAQRLRAAGQLTGVRIFLPARTHAVLHGLHLHVLPVLAEAADDAAVPRALAIGVVPAFPDADRREVRGHRRRGAPLVRRVVRDAVHANFARAPRLRGGPLDALV